VPYPPDYGGVIDVYYKIKALFDLGVKIHLHSYEYGRKRAELLEEFCEDVHYYKRHYGIKYSFSKLPYIVSTRSSKSLLRNLVKDEHPVLFEGLHTTFHIDNDQLSGRKRIVRTHNVEHEYYSSLTESEKTYYKKTYYKIESQKLKTYENILMYADSIAAISKNDFNHFNRKFNEVYYIPAFHPNNELNCRSGKGEYVLYHGNLSVAENVKACLFQINRVFRILNKQVIIAGRNPDIRIVNTVEKYNNIRLVGNPSNNEMTELISNAQVNVLTTFQKTGLKLKLLAALFNGRHCIVNYPMVDNTGLEDLCSVQENPEEIRAEIIRLYDIPFDAVAIERRKKALLEDFSNKRNAEKLLELL